jgi:hypothetical protein
MVRHFPDWSGLTIRGAWKLLPETNARYGGTEYTAEEQRRTIQGNHFFLNIISAP